MAVKLRLQRHGAKHDPVYRLVAADARAPRDGRFIEILGTYSPKATRKEEELRLKLDRADYWLSVGAIPSHTARSLINRVRREPPVVEEVLEETEVPVVLEKVEEAPVAEVPAAVEIEEPVVEERTEEAVTEEPVSEVEEPVVAEVEEPPVEVDEPVAEVAQAEPEVEAEEAPEEESKEKTK